MDTISTVEQSKSPSLNKRSRRRRINYPAPTLLVEWDKSYVWHPFTQMQDWVEDDIFLVESAKGSYLKDFKGRLYLDGVSSLWCNVHGHRVRKIDEAVRKQLSRVAHTTFLGLSNVPAVMLAKELIEIVPKGLARVFYSDSGSEAVETALKMAYQYWQLKGEKKRTKFIRLTNAYHGDTLGSASVGGIDLFHKIFEPLLFETILVEAPFAYRDNFKGSEEERARFYAQKMKSALKEHEGEICAVIMEPLVQGAAGIIVQPRGYMSAVRALASEFDTLLIFDEVATGFGRTGRMFASEHERITPDFLCLAKGLTGGYLPLAATLATEPIYQAFLGKHEEQKAFFHGHTYTANPLACAAALASLKIFREDKVLENLVPKIEFLSTGLKRFNMLGHVGDVRQAGFMVGIELVQDRSSKEPYEIREKIGIRVTQEARQRGVAIRPLGNVIVLMPPLSIKMGELKRLLKVVYRAIQVVTEGGS